jgi:hypothetical protein
MHCKFLKLTNGEDIIVQTDDTCESLNNKEFISVIKPVLIASMRIPRGPMVIESYIMQPWIKMAKADVVQITTKNIVVAVDVHEMAEKQYLQYVEEYNNRNILNNTPDFELEEEEEVSKETFEEFQQALREDSEEDDDGTPRTRPGRTLH